MGTRTCLIAPTLEYPANVLVVSGFPWYTTEAEIRQLLTVPSRQWVPEVTRLYENPANGASRGICFVEYKPHVDLQAVVKELHETMLGGHFVTAECFFLTNSRFDRRGRLPDLPMDPPQVPTVEGYGNEGFEVRCGEALGLANTVTEDGARRLEALRKRLRPAAAQDAE